jgi:uncharacterized membrane protein
LIEEGQDAARGRKAAVEARAATVKQPRRRYLSRRAPDVALALLFALVLFGFEWYRHATYRSTAFDLGVFDQAIWLMAHGKVPYATLVGRNIFLDHFSPILVLFVPLYWIAATPLWLFAAQSIAMGLGLLAMVSLLEELKLSESWKWAFKIAYVSSVLLWNSTLFDFHPTTLAVPFLFIGMTAALRDDRRMMLVAAVCLLALRDDLALSVIALAILGFTRSEHRRLRYALMGGGLLWLLIWGHLGIVAAFPNLWRGYYGYLGPTERAALAAPWLTVPRLVKGVVRRDNAVGVFAMVMSLGFLPLLRPSRLALGFIWLLPLLAASSALAPAGLHQYHYGAPIFPFLVLAAASGVTRLRPDLRRVAGFAVLVPLSVATFVLVQPLQVSFASLPRPDPQDVAAALRLIPAGAGVSASDAIVPHVSHRDVLLPFPYPFARGGQSFPLAPTVTEVSARAAARVDVIAFYTRFSPSTRRTIQALSRSPYFSGFELVYDRDGMFVYRRDTAGSAP